MEYIIEESVLLISLREDDETREYCHDRQDEYAEHEPVALDDMEHDINLFEYADKKYETRSHKNAYLSHPN